MQEGNTNIAFHTRKKPTDAGSRRRSQAVSTPKPANHFFQV